MEKKDLGLAIAASALAMGITLFFERGIRRGCQKIAEEEQKKELKKLQVIKKSTLESLQSRKEEISSRIREIEMESEKFLSKAEKASEENKKKVERIDSLLDLI